MRRRIMTVSTKQVLCCPTRLSRGSQFMDPRGNAVIPKARRLFLHVPDHSAEDVGSAVFASLESLDAARRSVAADDIFTLIPITTLRGWQSLAFNRQQTVEV